MTFRALQLLEEMNRRASARAFLDFPVYETQKRVICSAKMILALFGANQAGKTSAGTLRVTYDATGVYPDWWTGEKKTRGQDIWCIGETNGTTRDILQKKLFGPDHTKPGEGGWIPPDKIVGKPVMRPNLPGAFDTVQVRHASGGISRITFKSYEQGREALASWTGDLVLVDEEPPFDCFQELVFRVIKRKGQVLLTFTPLKGYTTLVNLLLGRNARATSDDEALFIEALKRFPVEKDFLTYDEAKHIDEEMKANIQLLFAGNPGQLKARMTGMPGANTGLVFPFDLGQIFIEPFPLSKSWPRLGALDVGYRHPTGALAGAHDAESDGIFIYNGYRQAEQPVGYHVAQLRGWGDLNFEIDPASSQVEKATGEQLVALYLDEWYGDRETWQSIPPEMRKFRKANNALMLSINAIAARMQTGRLYIFDIPQLQPLRQELENYVWDEKENNDRPKKLLDDLIDPLRYLVLGIEAGKATTLGNRFSGLNPQMMHDRSMLGSVDVNLNPWKPACRGY